MVGTRPEVIRLSRVIPRLDAHFEHVLVHTGQNYDPELNQALFADLALRPPDRFLSVAGASSAETIGNVIIEVDRVLAVEAPQALLVLGDTNSCMAVLPAKRRRIPVFHMEAGQSLLRPAGPRRRSIAGLSITRRISISRTARSPANTCCGKACRRTW